jgi:endoglucanase
VFFMPGGETGHLIRSLQQPKTWTLLATQPIHRIPAFAVWRLPDFRVKGDRLTARACDDLIGVAAALTALVQLKESGARVRVIAALTRAEEVGFHGALVLAANRTLPHNALILSLETSRELPPVKLGQGVIIRIGDRASTFDSAAARYLTEVANKYQQQKPRFRFQRALMSGGTCEATAYQEFGYQSAGVCVALGNYHNCGLRNQIAPEYVSVADALGMVELLVQASRHMGHFDRLSRKLPQRLNRLLAQARRRLDIGRCGRCK